MADYTSLHLDPDEHVILEVRKHWIVFAGHALGLLCAAFMPLIVFAMIKMLVPSLLKVVTLPTNINAYAFFLFFYILWLLALWLSFFIDWTKYFLDVWYVTEKRIIDVEQRRIFDREISNLRFDKIQDVTIDVHGFIPTMLNFGDVKVQTAAEDSGDFFLSTVRNPEEVRRVIFSQHNEVGDVPLRRAQSTNPPA